MRFCGHGHIGWGLWALAAALVAGCSAAVSPTPGASPVVASPTAQATRTPVPATSTPRPTERPLPTATRTLRPSPAPTDTARPEAEVLLIVEDCTANFCPPPWLDQEAERGVGGEPGILAVEAMNELSVRIIYDPTQLTEEQVVTLFVERTGFEVRQ